MSDAHDRGDENHDASPDPSSKSSNVGISLASEKLGFSKLYDAIIRYNLNEATGVDYPGEASGHLLDYTDWALITGYNVSFGQGISVTPLQMTRFYGALPTGESRSPRISSFRCLRRESIRRTPPSR